MDKKAVVFAILFLFATMLFQGQTPTAQATTLTQTRVYYVSTESATISTALGSYVLAHHFTSGTVSDTVCRVGQNFGNLTYVIWRLFLIFETDTLPVGASIVNWTLSLKMVDDDSTQDFDLTIQTGQPAYPHVPIVGDDYYYAYYSGNASELDTTGKSVDTYYNITSTNSTFLTLGGYTKLALRSSRDINTISPAGPEYIQVYSASYGIGFAPVLYVTYTIPAFTYHLYGPYYENGNIAPVLVNVTLEEQNDAYTSFILNGTGGTADNETVYAETPVAFTWNMSTLVNYTRTYYVTTSTFEIIYVFVGQPDEVFDKYEMPVIDIYGVHNATIETIITIGSTERTVERQSLGINNDLPFWMCWGRHYTLKLRCDEGTYSWDFLAQGVIQAFVIEASLFPSTAPGYTMTVNATRMNATWIHAEYDDTLSLTGWVYIAIKFRDGQTYTVAYSTNQTGNTVSLDWYSADNQTDYITTITAYRNSQTLTWNLSCQAPLYGTNVWFGLFDFLGTMPLGIAAENVLGFVLVMAFGGAFSYASKEAGMVAMVIVAGFLMYIRWLDVPVALFTFAFTIAILAILKARRERNVEV